MPLYNYQHAGSAHLRSMPFGQPHSLLADEPGTGKTIMTIDAAKAVDCRSGIIVCPAIIKEQWRRQMVSWGLCGEDEIQVVFGQDAVIDSRPWKIINYELVRVKEIHAQLRRHNYHMLTMDEAQRLKSHNSQQTNAILHKEYGIARSAYFKWALSGTIMPNRPLELYPILKSLAPPVLGKFNTWELYQDRYCGGQYIQGRGASHVDELTERLQPFMLRRELRDVWAECPPVIENDVWLDVPFQQHPEWMGSDFMQDATERRVIAAAKVPYTAAYLKDRLESGVDKLVVFTYHRETIDQLMIALAKYSPVKIYGGISAVKRLENLAKFAQDAMCRLFFIQIVSGGEGLDGLQDSCAEYVEAEPEWSPGREIQAGRRILRLGQKRTVISTRLLVSNSFEETIFYSNQRKRKVIDIVLKPNGGNFVMSIEAQLERIANVAEACAPLAQVLTQVLQAAVNGQQTPFVPQQISQPQAQAQFAPPMPAPLAAPAPIAAVGAPLTPPLPLPVAPALPQAAPQYTPAGVPAAPATQPAPAAPSAARVAFEKQVLDTLKPHGGAGMEKLTQLNQQFGITRLGELHEGHFAQFLSML